MLHLENFYESRVRLPVGGKAQDVHVAVELEDLDLDFLEAGLGVVSDHL